MASRGPVMRWVGAAGRGCAVGAIAKIGAFGALAFAIGLATFARAQMSSDEWSTDVAAGSTTSGQGARGRSGPDFPLASYGAIGSSMIQSGRFSSRGWKQAQITAFLDGMRAAFQGKPFPLDHRALQVLSDVGESAKTPGDGRPPAGQSGDQAADAELPISVFGAIASALDLDLHCAELGWTDAQVAAFLDGMRAAFQGQPAPLDENARRLLADISRDIADISARRKLEAPRSPDRAARLEWYMKRMRDRLGLQQADNGLAYRVESGRGGVRPRRGDTVVFTCVATSADGATKLPQMSSERVRMQMDSLLPGLMQGLQMMTIDSSAVFILVPKLSFGDNEWPVGVQRGAPIILTVTLYDVVPGPKDQSVGGNR